MSRVAIIGFAALGLSLSGCQKTQMKSVPKNTIPTYSVQPGGVFPPGQAFPVPVPLPPRPTGWEGFDPQSPPLPPPPPVPNEPQPNPNFPAPTPTYPSSTPEPYYPPPTVYPSPTPSYPQPQPQLPAPVPYPQPSYPTPQPTQTPRPIVTYPQPITPIPQPTPSTVTVVRPPQSPISRGTVLPSPLPPPQAVRQIPTATQYASATPVGGAVGSVTPVGGAVGSTNGPSIRTVRPPSRPAEFATTAVASNPPAATPAAADSPGVTVRDTILPVAGICEPRPVKVTKKNRKLDILFVVDTSDSLVKNGKGSREDGELASIAKEMPLFVHKLPTDTEYRIGVMIAHGPTVPMTDVRGKRLKNGGKASPYFGQLFSAGGKDPLVLDSKSMSEKQIAKALQYKMMNVPPDYSDAQGEAEILGLNELFTNPAKLKATMAAGLLRQKGPKSEEGRNLVIIVITDEQDVCYDYAGEGKGYKPTLKFYADRKTWEADRNEVKFFNEHCKAKDGHVISYRDVVTQLQRFQSNLDGKVIVQAITYKNPQPELAKNEDEKEQGHGVIELVEGMASGTIADMADVDRRGDQASFANELTQLGENAGFQLKFSSSFDCASKIHPGAIDPKEVELVITNNGRPLATYSAACEAGRPCQHGDGALKVSIDGKGSQAGMRVRPVDVDAFTRAMKAAGVEDAQFEIKFKTKADCDVKIGSCEDASAKPKATKAKTSKSAKAPKAKSAAKTSKAKAK